MADYVAVSRRNAIPLPKGLSPLNAALLGTAWLTAYRALFTKSRLPFNGLARSELRRIFCSDEVRARLSAPRLSRRQSRDGYPAASGFPAFPIFRHLGANSSDSLVSLHLRRLDAYVARTGTESQRGQDASDMQAYCEEVINFAGSSLLISGSKVRVLVRPPIISKA
jgi:hypothetical protein